MVCGTRVRRNYAAMKYFCPDNKKKNGCIEEWHNNAGQGYNAGKKIIFRRMYC